MIFVTTYKIKPFLSKDETRELLGVVAPTESRLTSPGMRLGAADPLARVPAPTRSSAPAAAPRSLRVGHDQVAHRAAGWRHHGSRSQWG
jgi:hypothetical protein